MDIEKYSNRLLGDRHYKAWPQDFFVKEFMDKGTLLHFISEIESREADLTLDGVNFLREHYGTRKIAEMLWDNSPGFPTKSIDGNQKFLEDYFEGVESFYRKNPKFGS